MVLKMSDKKKYTTEALKIDWKKQVNVTEWKKADAIKLADLLRPWIKHLFILYGGGGSGSDLVQLKGVKIEQAMKYPSGQPPVKTNNYIVIASVRALDKGNITAMFSDYNKKTGKRVPRTFTPHLGSWKLARVALVR